MGSSNNDAKLYFSTIYNIVLSPQSLRDASPRLSRKFRASLGVSRGGRAMFSLQQKIALAVIAPENLTKLDSPLGVSRGGSAPFCWRSRNQEVPCESLVPFFSQERNCQCGRHEPTKAKTFLKLCFEAECRDNVLVSAPNGHFCKNESFSVSLRSPPLHQLQAGLHQWCKGAQQRA